MRLWHEGQRAHAERLCFESLSRNPNDPQILGALAFMYSRSNRVAAAIELLQRARALAPLQGSICFNLGVLLCEQGRLTDAERCYRDALKLSPSSVETLTNLGQVLCGLKRFREAVPLLRQALAIRPRELPALVTLGNALLDDHDPAAALECFELAAQLSPASAWAHFNMGNALSACGRGTAAIGAFRRAIACDAKHADAHYNLANALRDGGQIVEAVESYRIALTLQPRHLAALNNLGAVLRATGSATEALECYSQIIAITPNDPMAHMNIGQAFVGLGQPANAIQHFNRALQLDPAYQDALCALGDALRRLDRYPEAILAYGRLLRVSPTHAAAAAGQLLAHLEQWDWAEAAELWERLRRDLSTAQPLPAAVFLYLSDDPAEQLRGAFATAAHHIAEVPAQWRLSGTAAARVRPMASRRVRLGYVSGDFHDHPVGRSLIEVLERHDRRDFAVVGVSIGVVKDGAMRQRIAAACDEFVDLEGQTTQQAVESLRRLDLDIGIDLAGFTDSSRPALLAHRPADVQVSYLGYSGTMGAPWIDYILADRFVIPEHLAQYYAEKIAWLPHCFFPSDTQIPSVPAPSMPPVSRRAESLPEEAVVLCCFNSLNRISADNMRIWARVLVRVEKAVLWLKRPASRRGQQQVLAFMQEHGVAASRIVFAEHASSRAYHLARHTLADLYVDSFPYNSHSTGRDALSMGVPLLTCAGNTFASRIAGSLLATLGVPESIAEDPAAYEHKAVALATDARKRRALRAEIERRLTISPLFDMRQLTQHVEAAYRHMLELNHAGLPPKNFSVAAQS